MARYCRVTFTSQAMLSKAECSLMRRLSFRIQMVKYFNPDMTIDKLKEIAAAYSIDDVVSRHGGNNADTTDN